MKKIFSVFLMLLVLCTCFSFTNPNIASAEFPNRPVGLVILDYSGNMDGKVYKNWRSVVKWAYHFPNYKIVDDDPKPTQTVKEYFGTGAKVDKAAMSAIAEKAGLDVLVFMPVYGCDYHLIASAHSFDGGDLKYWTDARAKIYIYKKDGDKFSKKTINEIGVREFSEEYNPEEIIKWALCKEVNIMEGRPVIGRDI